jgi:dipeptidyl-peptidase-3
MLGLPSSTAQSAYYQASSPITRPEIAEITEISAQLGIHPENTRLLKTVTAEYSKFDVIQASIEKDVTKRLISRTNNRKLHLIRGDHSDELRRTCEHLQKASEDTEDAAKKTYFSQLCRSFRTGQMEDYKDSQRTWVHDRLTTVETIFGFVEPYRDPCGMRAEYEGIVGIENPLETAMLHRLCDNADVFLKRLPWVDVQHGARSAGAFEGSTVQRPCFVSIECTLCPRSKLAKLTDHFQRWHIAVPLCFLVSIYPTSDLLFQSIVNLKTNKYPVQ